MKQLVGSLSVLVLLACPPPPLGQPDAGRATDAGLTDAGLTDAGPIDAGPTDAGSTDAGPTDAGPTDAGPTDAGPTDAGRPSLRALAIATGADLLGYGWVGSVDAGHIRPTFDGYADQQFTEVRLRSGQRLASGLTALEVTADGNLLLRRGAGRQAPVVWSALPLDAGAGCAPDGCLLWLQPHGNLVLYRTGNAPQAADALWFENHSLLPGADEQRPSGNALELSAFAPFVTVRWADGGDAWSVPNTAPHAPWYQRRGAPWERYQVAAVLRTLWLGTGDAEYLRRFEADWRHFKATFAPASDAGALTTCGLGPTVFANWASDDTGCTALYLLWVHELTGDAEALRYAKEALHCGFGRWLDVDAGGVFYNDWRFNPGQRDSAKSIIQVWMALAALEAAERAPAAPDAAQLRAWAVGVSDWLTTYRFTPVGGAAQRFRHAWQAADGGERVLFLSDVSQDQTSASYGAISGFPGRLDADGRPAPVEGTDLFSGTGEYYFGALVGLNLLQVRLHQLSGNPAQLDEARRLAWGITDTYRHRSLGHLVHDRDAWADAFLLWDWFSEVLPLPGMPLDAARTQARLSALHQRQHNRSPDGHYGPTWSGPWSVVWPSGAAAGQLHVSANAAHAVVVGALQP